MLAAKRASRPSSGHARLDAKFYEPVLKDLFACYDLHKDGLICPEAFASTQRLIKQLLAGLDQQEPRESATRELRGSAVAKSSPKASSIASMRADRQRHSVGSNLAIVGGHIAAPGGPVVKSRAPSPPARLARQTLELHSAACAPARSSSFVAYGSTPDAGISDFETFLVWQHRLLDASSQNSTDKQKRLRWLVDELNKLDAAQGRSNFWLRRQTAVKALASDVDVVNKLEENGDILAAIHKLEAALKQILVIIDEEVVSIGEGERFAERAAERQRQHLAEIKKRFGADFKATLQKDIVLFVALEAKLKQAADVMSKDELAPLFEHLQQCRKPFVPNIVTLAGDQIKIEASRTDTIEQVKQSLAAKLGMWSYRVGLFSEGEVLQDSKTLEELGICDPTVQLSVIVGECQKWREVSREEFIDLLVAKGVSTRAQLMKRHWPENLDEDFALRQEYVPQLEAAEKEAQRQRERKEEQQRKQELIAAEAKRLMATLDKEGARERIKVLTIEAEEAAHRQANECRDIKDNCIVALDAALPPLDAAIRGLDTLCKYHIEETRCFNRPPAPVRMVMETVCIMFEQKPTWDHAKRLLNDSCLIRKMIDYDKDNISPGVIKKIDQYIANGDFQPDDVGRCSMAASAFCRWVHAMHTYDRIAKEVQPQREALKLAEEMMDDALLALRSWQNHLAEALNSSATAED